MIGLKLIPDKRRLKKDHTYPLIFSGQESTSGHTLEAIGAIFGVHKSTVSRWLNK